MLELRQAVACTSSSTLMLNWVKKTIAACVWRYIDRQMLNFFECGDYETVLRHATGICQKREDSLIGQYWRALALLWLERYQESLDVANRVEDRAAQGLIVLNEPWAVAFEKIKCGALRGLKQYDALHDFSSRCLERHAGVVPIVGFQLLATMHLGTLSASTSCLHFLDCSVRRFDEAWLFVVLGSAHRYLGNEERASEITRLALAKYPDDDPVQEMAKKAKCVASASARCAARSRDVQRCRATTMQ